MPPIMGAAAFIMATYTETPYSQIMLVALIPAVLYFSGVFLGVHFESRKRGIVGMPKSALPNLKRLMIERGYLLLPILVIFYTLLNGRTPMRAALLGIAVSFLVSLFRRDTRMSFKSVLGAMEQGARGSPGYCGLCLRGHHRRRSRADRRAAVLPMGLLRWAEATYS